MDLDRSLPFLPVALLIIAPLQHTPARLVTKMIRKNVHSKSFPPTRLSLWTVCLDLEFFILSL